MGLAGAAGGTFSSSVIMAHADAAQQAA
jgi:hypothetical protein